MAQTTSTAPSLRATIGGTIHQFSWNWQGQSLTAVYEILGQGKPVLLLPAFSTVSTRLEMRGLAERIASQSQAIALDWVGFGASDRPPLDYQPALYQQFLQDFVNTVFDQPIALVAAGHSAGYAVQFAQDNPDRCSKLALLAPTWRGPLPTMGLKQSVRDAVRQTVRSRLIGQALYKLNTTPSFLKLMYRRHVYTNEANLTPEFIEQKYEITQQPGARFAPAAFVTGKLDPVNTQSEFLDQVRSLSIPILVVIGEQSPASSKAEMEAIANLPHVQTKRLSGSLGIHEEYAPEVAAELVPFLVS
jgi:pimeloyl-ACP methyl ester carboxylesterase